MNVVFIEIAETVKNGFYHLNWMYFKNDNWVRGLEKFDSICTNSYEKKKISEKILHEM